jgi:hypothetical protein
VQTKAALQVRWASPAGRAAGCTRNRNGWEDPKMSKTGKTGRHADKKLYRSAYLMELARGSSYIASTLTPTTQRAAIEEVLQEFRVLHGAEKLFIFRELLAESLEKRKNPQAAQAVLTFEPS